MILFVDFDGVLHPEPSNDTEMFCRAGLLWQILSAKPDVEVVLSTSWRELYPLDLLIEFVTHGSGDRLRDRIVGATPILINGSGKHQRFHECRLWLVGNNRQLNTWLAIDDHANSFPPGCANLYLTDKAAGLTTRDAMRIIDYISRGSFR